MAKYRIKNIEDLDKFEQLARIAFNLRLYSKIWKDHYGAHNRQNMNNWESKLDKFLAENIEVDNEDGLTPEIPEKWDKLKAS